MATVYGIHCPACGHGFEVMKGILVNECGKEVAEDREWNRPFRCPDCGKEFSVQDEDFQNGVQYTVMVD